MTFEQYSNAKDNIDSIYKFLMVEVYKAHDIPLNEALTNYCGTLIKDGDDIGVTADNLKKLIDDTPSYENHPALQGKDVVNCIKATKQLIIDRLKLKNVNTSGLKLADDKQINNSILDTVIKAIDKLRVSALDKMPTEDAKKGAKLVLNKLEDYISVHLKR